MGLGQTAGVEEVVEEQDGGGREASEAGSCPWFILEGTSPAVASTAGVTMLACEGTEPAGGCRRGWVEWIEAGAVLGPASNWFCLSSEKACCKLTAPADGDNPIPWDGV